MNAQLNTSYSPFFEPAVKNLDTNALFSSPIAAASNAFLAADVPSISNHSSSLLFIDQTVEAYQSLVAAAAPGTEVYVLDAAQDAIAQITAVLSGRSNIASLHIVSHGDNGRLDFGNTDLTLTNLPQYVNQVQSWAAALTDDADILMYGCNVAQGELGKAFVQILSQLTQADVQASTDLTGYGGDWTLEFQHGAIETTVPFSSDTLKTYQGNLLGTDYTNDGQDDLVQFNPLTGAVSLLVNGTDTTKLLKTVGRGWELAGMADFDGNKTKDLVWQNRGTGATAVWLMNNLGIQKSVALPNTGARSDWRIVGLADFDKNGTPDLLLRSSSREATSIWLMKGAKVIKSQALSRQSRDWVVSGVADVNNDGSTDILWRNPLTGANEFWLMNKTARSGSMALPGRESQWVIHGLGDWNQDQSTDILWRNYSTGETSIWSLQGGTYQGNTNVQLPGNNATWTILDTRDLDGNGTPDLIARNYITGENGFWMMQGTNCTNMVAGNTVAGVWDIFAA